MYYKHLLLQLFQKHLFMREYQTAQARLNRSLADVLPLVGNLYFYPFLTIPCILSHYLPFQDNFKVFIASTSERFLPKLLDNSMMPLLVCMDIFADGPKRHH